MGKELLEELRDLRHAYDVTHVNFFNTGKVSEDEAYFTTRIDDDNSMVSFGLMKTVLVEATKSYSRDCDFDEINMDLLLGLVYKVSDVDEDKKIKEDAKPVQGTVRFYTGSVKANLDGEKTNTFDYYENGINFQGYINYGKLVKYAKECGLVFTGPDSFEEFKQKILSGEVFDVSLKADLKERSKESAAKRSR